MYHWQKLEHFLEEIEKKYEVPGGEIRICKEGKEIFSKAFGERLGSEKDLYWFYSMSKVYTAVSLMQLYERGLLSLDQKLVEFFPELSEMKFSSPEGEALHVEKVKIRNLLSMTGGLNYNIMGEALQTLREKKGSAAEVEEVVAAIFQDAFEYEPGTHFLYSLCHDVAGAVVYKVTGMKLDAYMKANIFEPLGIENLGFYPTEEQKKRFLPQYSIDPESGKPDPVSTENHIVICDGFASGGAGLFGNLHDYMKLPLALANMGKAENGVQILKPETIETLREDQLNPLGVHEDLMKRFQDHGMEGFSYGLGVRVRIEDTGSSPVGEFGWDGAAGGYVLIDTTNQVTLCYLQHVMNMGKVYGEIHPTLRQIVYETLV